MRKIETIWHEVLFSALTRRKYQFTQQELAKKFRFSLSTVNHAVVLPERIGAIRRGSKSFTLISFEKLLLYWGSRRNLGKDIIYQTRYEASVSEIEGLMPPQVIYAAFSAAGRILKDAPADYDQVYVYLEEEHLDLFKSRLSPKSGRSNVIVLKSSPAMRRYGAATSIPQTFVDLWNIKEWFAWDYVLALKAKINQIQNGILS